MLQKAKKLFRYITDSNYRFLVRSNITGCPKMEDKEFLCRKFKICMGRELDLKAPKTFNEKLQWLKLNDRRPEYTMMVDKYLVRDHIRKVLGEEYLIPLIGVWDSPDEIDFDALPERFVLKCNHNSGVGMYICRDKSKMEVEAVKKELRRGLAQDYYLTGREWPYKNVPRKIICEKFMSDTPDASDFTDYKFFCFNGKVDCVMVCLERSSGDTKFYFFDEDWKLKRLNIRGKNAPEGFTIPKPSCMDEMFKIAAKLSKGMPFVRVDLYQSNDQIYFGELTFFPDSGFDGNLLSETDEYFGSLIDISNVKE
ncbi:MAG: glycosyl transferase [Ruminococcaceae bacterium]|nr:glycosyl transferase [Oscillospiraceae bacterium]